MNGSGRRTSRRDSWRCCRRCTACRPRQNRSTLHERLAQTVRLCMLACTFDASHPCAGLSTRSSVGWRNQENTPRPRFVLPRFCTTGRARAGPGRELAGRAPRATPALEQQRVVWARLRRELADRAARRARGHGAGGAVVAGAVVGGAHVAGGAECEVAVVLGWAAHVAQGPIARLVAVLVTAVVAGRSKGRRFAGVVVVAVSGRVATRVAARGAGLDGGRPPLPPLQQRRHAGSRGTVLRGAAGPVGGGVADDGWRQRAWQGGACTAIYRCGGSAAGHKQADAPSPPRRPSTQCTRHVRGCGSGGASM